jgi:hypothetical protein
MSSKPGTGQRTHDRTSGSGSQPEEAHGAKSQIRQEHTAEGGTKAGHGNQVPGVGGDRDDIVRPESNEDKVSGHRPNRVA